MPLAAALEARKRKAAEERGNDDDDEAPAEVGSEGEEETGRMSMDTEDAPNGVEEEDGEDADETMDIDE